MGPSRGTLRCRARGFARLRCISAASPIFRSARPSTGSGWWPPCGETTPGRRRPDRIRYRAWTCDPEATRDRGIDPDLHSLIFPTDREARPVRVYFGNEFCELRIPKRGEFEDSCTVVHEAGLPLTFVTPPATDKGMRTLFDRLTDLQRWSPESEVVVNDWGTLHLVNEEFTSLTPLLGRLMSKLLRDPRITPRCDDPGVSSEALGSLRKCSLNISAYRSLLTSYGGS